MPEINIPVTWEVFGVLKLNYTLGESLEQVVDRALHLPLPIGDYIDDSLHPDWEAISIYNADNPNFRADFPQVFDQP
ncbi:hypothetical protein IQ250_11390 [Pseudanabaenaceae cyanobacterium LEGE 13415]|nr:hypothetical protein [Pseudanabaenaceae cyanobacterium LEGE 13415]